MSIENPTIEQVEDSSENKPSPSLSGQFNARRKDKLKERDEKTRADLKNLFNRYETSKQRIGAMQI